LTMYIYNFKLQDVVEAPRRRRKYAGSIPDVIIRIFHWHNTSGCIMFWDQLNLYHQLVKVKVKQSLYRSRGVQGVPGS